MTLEVAKARAQVWGTKNAWSLSPGGAKVPSQECDISLEIQGNDWDGYHLVMSPAGFFTADYWYHTKQDAVDDAEQLFGVHPDSWSENISD